MSLFLNNNVGYTVVDGGNIHIEDGVVSGFSVNDYLSLNTNPTYTTTDVFEWNIKFTTGSSMQLSWLLSLSTSTIMCGIYYGTNGVLFVPVGSGSQYGQISGLTTETTYIINVLKKSDGNLITTLKSANGTIISTQTKNIGNVEIVSTVSKLGQAFSSYFNGSIDLNETYIKVNGITWFNGKQQASTTVNDVYLNRNVGYSIVGSPTIVDGVVSGCDYDNYLNLNSLFPDSNNSDMDVFITLKSAGIGAGKGYRAVFAGLYGITIALTNSSTPTFSVRTKKSGESTYTTRSIYNYSAQVDSNNNFYLHFTKNGNVLSIQGANNDGVFKTASTYTLEEGEEIDLTSVYPEVMHGGAWGNIENSAIDLNNTYIKVNGITWFNGKQQASPTINEVYFNRNVGYTIVGSPTINNGIVSGFSENDYLSLPTTLDLNQNFEICFRFNTGEVNTMQFLLGTIDNNISNGLRFDYQNSRIQAGTQNAWINMTNIRLSFNTDYKIIWKRINDDVSLEVFNIDGTSIKSMTVQVNSNVSNITTINLGTSATQQRTQFMEGSIDLNSTYIKVNGVVWFNGKDVNFSNQNNYIINNGNLVWANPNLWLESSGTQYINTELTLNLNDTVEFDVYVPNTQSTTGSAYFYESGSDANNNRKGISLYNWSSSSYSFYYNYGQSSLSAGFGDLYNQKINIKTILEGGTFNIYFNNVLKKSVTEITNTNSTNLTLFSTINHNSPIKARIYFLKVIDCITNQLKHYFVPVPKGLVIGNYTVPSNGMWDIVTQTFFGNQGTGSFTFGKDGTTPVWTRSV